MSVRPFVCPGLFAHLTDFVQLLITSKRCLGMLTKSIWPAYPYPPVAAGCAIQPWADSSFETIGLTQTRPTGPCTATLNEGWVSCFFAFYALFVIVWIWLSSSIQRFVSDMAHYMSLDSLLSAHCHCLFHLHFSLIVFHCTGNFWLKVAVVRFLRHAVTFC